MHHHFVILVLLAACSVRATDTTFAYAEPTAQTIRMCTATKVGGRCFVAQGWWLLELPWQVWLLSARFQLCPLFAIVFYPDVDECSASVTDFYRYWTRDPCVTTFRC